MRVTEYRFYCKVAISHQLQCSRTSHASSLLYDEVDLFERRQQLLVVATADLVAVDQVAVHVVQFCVTLLHVTPEIQYWSLLN